MTQEMTATPADSVVSTPAPAAQPPHWIESISDTALKDFAINKGYHRTDTTEALPTILRQYQSLEKLVGAEKAGRTVELPDFDNPEAASKRDAFYERLGRPAKATDYDLGFTAEEGVDAEFDKWARETFHGNGLTAKQANALGKAWVDFATAQTQQDALVTSQRAAQEDAALRQQWGAAYDNRVAKAASAAKAFGVSPEAIDAMQSVMGYGQVMQHFNAIAEAMGEHEFVGNADNNALTPYDAQEELNRFYNDPEMRTAWVTKNHPRHQEAVERHHYLQTQKHAGKAV